MSLMAAAGVLMEQNADASALALPAVALCFIGGGHTRPAVGRGVRTDRW